MGSRWVSAKSTPSVITLTRADSGVRSLETNGPPDGLFTSGTPLTANPPRHGARRDASGLCVADATEDAAPRAHAHARQLCGLARTGGTAHHDNALRVQGASYVGFGSDDGEVWLKRGGLFGQCAPPRNHRSARGELLFECMQAQEQDICLFTGVALRSCQRAEFSTQRRCGLAEARQAARSAPSGDALRGSWPWTFCRCVLPGNDMLPKGGWCRRWDSNPQGSNSH